MRIVAIVQARMASTRLPGKVLADVEGKPLVQRVIERAKRATTLEGLILATSDQPVDNPLADLCRRLDVPCFRGSEQDVLDRYFQAASQSGAEGVVRLTADCPLLDPEVIDRIVETFMTGGYDYVSNTVECTYPDGLDAEAFTFAALSRAHAEATKPSEREHVTPYIHQRPEVFRRAQVWHAEDLSAWRWTVDEPRDLELVRAVYREFGDRPFDLADVQRFLREHPSLMALNAGIRRNEGYVKSLLADTLATKTEEA